MLWPTDYRSEEETDANAHMIAASPELYEALENLLDDMAAGTARTTGCFDAARTALAKARGDTPHA